MKRSSEQWAIGFFLLLAGCARPDVPEGLSSSSEALRLAAGARILVRLDSSIARGELLSVEPDTLFLIHGDTLCAIGKDDVREVKAFLQAYPVSSGEVAGWTTLGTLSTISNGFGLMLTAPLWIITGTVTGIMAASRANNGDYHYPEDPWPGLRKFARFPQGLPQGIPRKLLRAHTDPAGPAAESNPGDRVSPP
jgi:hypothetical protein